METKLNTSTDDVLDSFNKEIAFECNINTSLKTIIIWNTKYCRGMWILWWKTNGI